MHLRTCPRYIVNCTYFLNKQGKIHSQIHTSKHIYQFQYTNKHFSSDGTDSFVVVHPLLFYCIFNLKKFWQMALVELQHWEKMNFNTEEGSVLFCLLLLKLSGCPCPIAAVSPIAGCTLVLFKVWNLKCLL